MIKAALVTLAALVGVGANVAVATPAQAAYSDCFIGHVCLWDGLGGTGTLLYSSHAGGPGTCVNIPTSANDRADSFYNHMGNGRHVQFYQNANCTGHAAHKLLNGVESGGAFDPFYDGETGNFMQGGKGPCHCDRNMVTSIFFNTG